MKVASCTYWLRGERYREVGDWFAPREDGPLPEDSDDEACEACEACAHVERKELQAADDAERDEMEACARFDESCDEG